MVSTAVVDGSRIARRRSSRLVIDSSWFVPALRGSPDEQPVGEHDRKRQTRRRARRARRRRGGAPPTPSAASARSATSWSATRQSEREAARPVVRATPHRAARRLVGWDRVQREQAVAEVERAVRHVDGVAVRRTRPASVSSTSASRSPSARGIAHEGGDERHAVDGDHRLGHERRHRRTPSADRRPARGSPTRARGPAVPPERVNTISGRCAAATSTPSGASRASVAAHVGDLHRDRVHAAAEALDERRHRRPLAVGRADLDRVVAEPGHPAVAADRFRQLLAVQHPTPEEPARAGQSIPS